MYDVWKNLRMYFKAKQINEQYGPIPILLTLSPDLMVKIMEIERERAAYRERRRMEFRDKLREATEELERFRKRVES